MIEVYGARVRQARVLRRLAAKSVADALGWNSNRQTKIEKSIVISMSAVDVNMMAELFRFPVKFFATPPNSRVSPSDLLFRAPKSMTVGEQEFLAAFASLAGDFLADLDEMSKLPPVRVPAIVDDGPRRMPIAAAAQQLRDAMGVDRDEPLDDLMYEAERLGAPVIVRRRVPGEWESEFAADPGRTRSEKHLGYSTWVGRHRDRPLIVLRESESWERTRFTVAHELGHLVLHSRPYCCVNSTEEQEANRFATELLAPAAVVAGELPRVMSLLNLKPLKDKWGLSLGALIMHMRDSGLIHVDRAKMLTTQLHGRLNPETGHTWGMTEPGWKDRVAERPRLVRKWVERCFGAAVIPALTARESMIFPADVLDWFLATQRPAPRVDRVSLPAPMSIEWREAPAGTPVPEVIQLADFRRSRVPG